MKLTPAQAAAAVGMTKAGIIRAIHKGKLSATRNEDGHFEIDPAELFRVYEPVATVGNSNDEVDANVTDHQSDSLRDKVEMLERMLRDKDDVIADLRKRLDAESDERRKLTMLLTTAQQPAKQETPKRKGFWARIFGSEE
jgi:hypothetical protein